MPADQSFEHLLAELGSQAGTDLAPDPNGVVTLLVDEVRLSLESPRNSRFVYLHAPVRRLGPDRARDLGAAMASNLFALPLSGAWLALDSESDELVLCYSVQRDQLDAALLAATIEAAVHAVAELREAANAVRDVPHQTDSLGPGLNLIRA